MSVEENVWENRYTGPPSFIEGDELYLLLMSVTNVGSFGSEGKEEVGHVEILCELEEHVLIFHFGSCAPRQSGHLEMTLLDFNVSDRPSFQLLFFLFLKEF